MTVTVRELITYLENNCFQDSATIQVEDEGVTFHVDDADSLALACYFFDYHQQSGRFVRVLDPVVSRIRELVLRLNHLNRVRSPIINRAPGKCLRLKSKVDRF